MSSVEALGILKNWQSARAVLHSELSISSSGIPRELFVFVSAVSEHTLELADAESGVTISFALDGAVFDWAERSLQISIADGRTLLLTEG